MRSQGDVSRFDSDLGAPPVTCCLKENPGQEEEALKYFLFSSNGRQASQVYLQAQLIPFASKHLKFSYVTYNVVRVCDALVFRVVEPFSLRDTNQEVNLVFVCDQVLLCMLKTGPAVTDGTVLPPVGGRGQK